MSLSGSQGGLMMLLSVVVSILSASRNHDCQSTTESKSKPKETISIKELWIYPIKSCGGIQVQSADISKTGLKYDRTFMVIDESNKFISQRTMPSMSLVSVRLQVVSSSSTSTSTSTSTSMVISAPNMIDLIIDLNSPCETMDIEATVWGDKCLSREIVAGSRFFSSYLAGNYRLVRINHDFKRPTEEKYAPDGQTAFADGYPFLLASQESLDCLNSKLAVPVTMARFRPNIVVHGCADAFVEDRWGDIVFSRSTDKSMVIAMKIVKPCSRCQMPNIDPLTGVFDVDNQPSKTMKQFRTGEAIGLNNDKWKKTIFFGQNVDHKGLSSGTLHVGDILTPTATVRESVVDYYRNSC